MKKFSRILESQKAELGIITTNKYGTKSISALNGKIRLYLNEIYKPFGYSYGKNFDEDINVDGMLINTQYINKMVNNYMTFKRIIQLEGLRTEDEFYSYMENNMSDVYHWKGKYFLTYVLPILIATSRRGNEGEINSLRFFVEELNKKMNIAVDIIAPSIQEDVSGIDAKFMWNNKELTIQVKPFTRIVKSDESVKVYSQGSLSLNTDYLILYKILPSNNYSFIILRRRDVTIKSDYFEADLNQIVAEE
jgi:hypothetical protein